MCIELFQDRYIKLQLASLGSGSYPSGLSRHSPVVGFPQKMAIDIIYTIQTIMLGFTNLKLTNPYFKKRKLKYHRTKPSESKFYQAAFVL